MHLLRRSKKIMANFPKGIYAITPTYFTGDHLIKVVQETINEGVKVLQYRFNESIREHERLVTAKRIMKICKKSGVIFVVNNDFSLANKIGAGLHIGQDIKNTDFLKDFKKINFIGLSCKDDLSQQTRGDHSLFSYFSFGPAFESKTKKNLKGPINIEKISGKIDRTKINVAIGGIDRKNIAEIKKNGFDMAAICEGIYNDPTKISRNIKELTKIWNEN